jgi:hypothetical protein
LNVDDEGSPLPAWSTVYTRGPDGKATSSQTTISESHGDGQIATYSYSAEWVWSTSGSVELQAEADDGAWQETFRVPVAAGETAREHDELGNLARVHVDEDGDGSADVTHTYRYEGEGPCAQGTNPQLVERIPGRARELVPFGCRFSATTPAIVERYFSTQYSFRSRWVWK